MRFLTTPDLQGWSLAKSGNYKFSSKIRFLTTLDLRMKFGKIQNSQSRWKFDSKLTLLTTKDLGRLKSLTTQNMRRIKVGKIQKFLVALKIWRKIWEIWPLRTCGWWNVAKSRNFLSHWKFGSKMRVLTTPNQQRMKFDKIQKNFDLCCKFDSKMRLTTLDLWRMKFGKIQKFSVALKIWLKNESFDHSEPAKDEIWQNPEKFWSVLQIWLKNEIDHSGPVEDEIWQNPEIFSRIENLAWNQEFDHSWPAKDEILQNQEILICVKNFAQNWHLWLNISKWGIRWQEPCAPRSKFVKFLIMTFCTYSSWSISLVARKHGQKSLFTCYVVCLCHWLAY